MIASDLVRRGCEQILKKERCGWKYVWKKILVVFTKYDFKLFLLIPLLPESQVNTSADPRPSTACDVIALTIKTTLSFIFYRGRGGGAFWNVGCIVGGGRGGRWGGGKGSSSSNQPYAYPCSNFPNLGNSWVVSVQKICALKSLHVTGIVKYISAWSFFRHQNVVGFASLLPVLRRLWGGIGPLNHVAKLN